MKKYLQYILIATISAVLLSACNKDEDNTVTLTAIVADQLNGGNAKVYINETGGVKYGCWQNGDTVSINGAKKYLSVTSGESLTAAINDVDASNTGYTAGYPYGKTTYGGTPKSISIDIPAVQEYISADDYSGTGASANQRLLCPMAAYCGSNGSSLKFHNVGAVLKVTVSNSYEELLTLHSVEVESEDATVPLSGTCSVTMNDAGEISEATYEGSSKTTLDLSNAGKSLEKNGDPIDLYIPIMPIKESKKTKITIHVYAKGTPDGASSENKYTFHGTSASTVWVDRNQIGAVSIELSSSNKTANDPYFWGQGNSWCPFLIEDYEDLKQLSSLVAVEDNDGTYNHSNCYYKQTKDITITDANWGTSSRLAVGSTTNAFKAKYDGNNDTIKMAITSATIDYPVGVFGVVGGGAKIEHVITKGSISFSAKTDVGAVVGKIIGNATISSCVNEATVTSTYTTENIYGIGGICGRVDASGCSVTIEDCINAAQVKAYNLRNGGMVGLFTNGTSLNIENCHNNGAIVSNNGGTYYNYCGGMIGAVSEASGTVTLSDCINNNTVTGKQYVGGLIGYLKKDCELDGCSNTSDGVVYGSSMYVGGMIGYSDGASVTLSGDITQNGNVTGLYYIGGAVGYMNKAPLTVSSGADVKVNSTIKYCGSTPVTPYYLKNSSAGAACSTACATGGHVGRSCNLIIRGKVEVDGSIVPNSTKCELVGGIVGLIFQNLTAAGQSTNTGLIAGNTGTTGLTIESTATVKNKAAVTGSNYVGGILGYANFVACSACVSNEGDITGSNNQVGGIVGATWGDFSTTSVVSNSGTIKGVSYVGGIVGKVGGTTTISGTVSNNKAITATGQYVGGIIGYTNGTINSMSGVTNNMGVSGTNNVGGVIGYANHIITSISGASNKGTVSGTDNIGGIIGNARNSTTLSGPSNDGNISGTNNIGGVIGYAYGTTSISSASNEKPITGTYYIGGIIGYAYNTTTLTSSIINNGSITGDSAVAGIIGYANNATTISGTQNTGTVTGTARGIGGICGVTYNTVTISGNVSTSGSNIISGSNAASYVGGIIGHHRRNSLTIQSGATVTNGQAIKYAKDRSGGIIGYSEGNITISGSVVNNGTVSAIGENVGGIIGSLANNKALTITGSATNNSSVTGPYNVAGIMGFSNGKIDIKNCTNNATIIANGAATDNNTEFGVAGIVGRNNQSSSINKIDRCVNTGDIRSDANDGDYNVAGIIGYTNYTCTITNSYNTGHLSGDEKYIGGIIARATGNNTSVTNCCNKGDISGTLTGGCGGIAFSVAGNPMKINNCYNYGTISASGVTRYSIAGKSDKNLRLFNCYGLTGTTLSNATGNDDKEERCKTFDADGNFSGTVAIAGENVEGTGTVSDCTTLREVLEAWRSQTGLSSTYTSWTNETFPIPTW